MLTAVATIPSAPVLVPQLAGAAGAEFADVRGAVLRAAAALPPRWWVVGAGTADEVIDAHSAGSFAGYGVDVRVALSPHSGADRDLPLCALVAAWVREQTRPQGHAQVRIFAGDHSVEAAGRRGVEFGVSLAEIAEPVGVLVVADGVHTLTPTAPGGHDPDSIAVHDALGAALARADPSGLAAVPPSVPAHVAWHVLAGIAATGRWSAESFYQGAPLGVGYYAALWRATER